MASKHQNAYPLLLPRIVIAVLLLSLILRWALVIRGGQYYFSDEHRYEVSPEFVDLILQGKIAEGLSRLFTAPEHLGYKIIGILPALIEKLTGPSLLIPALFFSLFSVLNLYLIFLLAKRAGATHQEALLALGIAAATHSLLYYSRHLMPYDTAMTFGLLSLYVGLKKEAKITTSLLCGALGFLCFITYNGYWLLAGFAMLCHVVAGEKNITTFLRRGLLLTTGFVIPLLLIVIVSNLAGINFITEYTKFANTVTQGDCSEGWSLPFEYFWHSEHLLIIILAALAVVAVYNMVRTGDRHPLWWLAGLLGVYVCLVFFSVFTHSFVVLGRLARQMLPFLILLSAYGLSNLVVRKPFAGYVSTLIMLAIVAQGLWNYGISFGLAYPRDFSNEAQAQYPDFTFSPKRLLFGAPPVCENNGYAMENAKYFLSATDEIPPDIQGIVLMSQPHPINFLPYQYEGYPPQIRQQFRDANLQMALYKLDEDADLKNIKNCFIKE